MDTRWVVPNTSKVNRISSVQMLSVGHRGHKVGCTKYFKGQQDIKCPYAECRAPWTQGGLSPFQLPKSLVCTIVNRGVITLLMSC